jgi:SAM-dependent methyltransferase
MFEVFLVFIFCVLIFLIDIVWVKIFLLVLAFLLVLPGIYAMYYGAPCVPSLKKAVRAIFLLGNFGKKDSVVELGCGRGQIIRKIASCNVKKAVGYELSVPTYIFAKVLTLFDGSRAKIEFGNFWNKDLGDFNVIVCFLMEDTMRKFEKDVWPDLKNGTRVLANVFGMPNVKCSKKMDGVYLYVKK